MTSFKRHIEAAYNVVAAFTIDPAFARLPSDALITMGSRMAMPQLNAGNFRTAQTALEKCMDAIADGAGGIAVHDPVHTALQPMRKFVTGSGFNIIPDSMPITTDQLRQRLSAGELRMIAGLSDILEQAFAVESMSGSVIKWEPHDDVENGFISSCGQFEVSTDPVYGNYRLHRAGDMVESLCESMSLDDITRAAARLAEHGSPEP